MMIRRILVALALLAVSGLVTSTALAQQGPPPGAQGPGPGGPPSGSAPRRRGLVPMYVESMAFPDGGIVPPKYSMAGGSTQPDFKIIGAPAETQSFAIILHDIDVALGGPGDVLHWVAWNIPGDTTQIQEGKLPEGSVNGLNMSRRNGYMGMGAPAGPRYHHYVFEFYALNAKLDLPPTASRDELLQALQGKVIAKCGYIGRFRSEPGAGPAGPPPAR
ncbi:MAG TPA: YbhB/YbcL family Raf kinase inhibitor-like protein [Steroidobacteraceae bacterium]|nr:YbhB/YbcL family Raf kinase inhibitor-like protein [Steroidobacteraceae bacterium]